MSKHRKCHRMALNLVEEVVASPLFGIRRVLSASSVIMPLSSNYFVSESHHRMYLQAIGRGVLRWVSPVPNAYSDVPTHLEGCTYPSDLVEDLIIRVRNVLRSHAHFPCITPGAIYMEFVVYDIPCITAAIHYAVMRKLCKLSGLAPGMQIDWHVHKENTWYSMEPAVTFKGFR